MAPILSNSFPLVREGGGLAIFLRVCISEQALDRWVRLDRMGDPKLYTEIKEFMNKVGDICTLLRIPIHLSLGSYLADIKREGSISE